ncbi:hypothetical protein V6N13_129528 [Hibiscus sabdariffa]|uniref:Uncharacterized protein n=1 Tax=Hibiscus sabdariffa TaxID=183260 RepID=A0ABR2SLE9_9ROSI
MCCKLLKSFIFFSRWLQKSKVARKKHWRFWKRKDVEKEKEKELEAKAGEMRRELKQMKREERKFKAKLRKAERVASETREAIRLASLDDAQAQLCFQALLPLLDD